MVYQGSCRDGASDHHLRSHNLSCAYMLHFYCMAESCVIEIVQTVAHAGLNRQAVSVPSCFGGGAV